jgi:hypothetical protein
VVFLWRRKMLSEGALIIPYKSILKNKTDQLSQVYFALQGITQGVAVYFLAYYIYMNFFDDKAPLNANHISIGVRYEVLAGAMASICCFSYLVFITFEFLVCYAGFWIGAKVGLVDIYIVVSLGICQVFPMFAISDASKWCSLVIPLGFIGIAAYLRSLFWIPNLYYEPSVLFNLKNKTLWDIYSLMSANVICVVVMVFLRMDRIAATNAQILISCALISFCTFRGLSDAFFFKRLREREETLASLDSSTP